MHALLPPVVVSADDHDAFPGLAWVNNAYLCVYRFGAGHTSTDGGIRSRTSADGQSWGAAASVFSDASFDLRGGTLNPLASGRVVMTCAALSSAGAQIVDGAFTLYTDDGSTWSTPERVDADFTEESKNEGPMAELAGGDWLFAMYGSDTGDAQRSVRAYRSSDTGANWTVAGSIADGEADGREYTETGLVRNGSNILAVIREQFGSGLGGRYWRSRSTDEGESWSALTQILTTITPGGRPAVMQRADDTLVMPVRNIVSETFYPLTLWESSDFGDTWTQADVYIEGAKSAYAQFTEVDGVLGLAYAIESDNGATGTATTYFRQESPPGSQTTCEFGDGFSDAFANCSVAPASSVQVVRSPRYGVTRMASR